EGRERRPRPGTDRGVRPRGRALRPGGPHPAPARTADLALAAGLLVRRAGLGPRCPHRPVRRARRRAAERSHGPARADRRPGGAAAADRPAYPRARLLPAPAGARDPRPAPPPATGLPHAAQAARGRPGLHRRALRLAPRLPVRGRAGQRVAAPAPALVVRGLEPARVVGTARAPARPRGRRAVEGRSRAGRPPRRDDAGDGLPGHALAAVRRLLRRRRARLRAHAALRSADRRRADDAGRPAGHARGAHVLLLAGGGGQRSRRGVVWGQGRGPGRHAGGAL
ncbi:MAG: hypothetical protein AVDCRST_MAG45-2535, partial [uncultured Solirubrobacterales bacterium]